MTRPARTSARVALRYAALLLALLFAQHHIAVTADPGVPTPPAASGLASFGPRIAAAASVHPGDVPVHHPSSHDSHPAPSAHCGMLEAALAPPSTTDRADLAYMLASGDVPLLHPGSGTRGPAESPGLVAPHNTRQALLQVFLH